MEKYVGCPYPFTTFKLVFIDDPYLPMDSGVSMAIVSTHLLLQKDIIDQVQETHKVLYQAVAAQWLRHFVTPKSW